MAKQTEDASMVTKMLGDITTVVLDNQNNIETIQQQTDADTKAKVGLLNKLYANTDVKLNSLIDDDQIEKLNDQVEKKNDETMQVIDKFVTKMEIEKVDEEADKKEDRFRLRDYLNKKFNGLKDMIGDISVEIDKEEDSSFWGAFF